MFEEEHNLIISQQFGFRSKHSTTHQILRLVEEISFDFNKDLTTGMILFDIEKAFDSIWHDGLIHKMIKCNFPTYLIKIILSFLSKRNFFVNVNKSFSNDFEIPAGVPQGSLLSPYLFNFFINAIPSPPNCSKAIYADNTIFKITDGYLNS
jgi:retron-type reverse transcriptase